MKKIIILVSLLFVVSCVQDRRPKAPSNLKINISEKADYLVLFWSDNSDNEDGFQVFRNGTLDTTLNTNIYFDYEIEKDSTYVYEIFAFNEYGARGIKKTVTIPGPPASVDTLTAIPAFHKVKLEWPDVEGESGYVVVRDNNKIAEFDFDVITFIDSGLEINTEYAYILYAENQYGLSEGKLALTKTIGAWQAIWNRSIDFIDGNIQNGYATGYNLYLLKDGLPELLYTGPDTNVIFYRD